MNGIGKTLNRFIHNFKGSTKDEKAAKTNMALADFSGNQLQPGVVEDDLEEPLEVVPEEMTSEELQELEQNSKTEEDPRKEIVGENKSRLTPKKIHREGFAEAFAELNTLLKKYENVNPSLERFL